MGLIKVESTSFYWLHLSRLHADLATGWNKVWFDPGDTVWSGPALIKPDQLDPWIKGWLKMNSSPV